MILADKIILLRKRAGWNQEELAEQLNVSRQSVSKWEGGLSVPDLNKIIAMSALFGVSTDYLLKDDLEKITPSETADSDDRAEDAPRCLEMEEVNRYFVTVKRVGRQVAVGVMLCILSPITLILLAGLAEEGVIAMGESLAACIGVGVLFLLVGAAIALFVPAGMTMSQYEFLEKEPITLAYGVGGIVEKQQNEYRPRFVASLTLGIVGCVFSVPPLVVLGALGFPDSVLIGCVGLMFLLCAFSVAGIVTVSYRWGAYQRLLQEGEFTKAQKKEKKRNQTAETAYWSLCTGIYLLVSFLTFSWYITWVIWPVAGCLYPVFQLIVDSIRKDKDRES